ncbi:TetR/AcrR family transcriptional regulator [Paenibacillus qinlingensis]|uniref:TetR/AcrR family transcriptional regulator n=1 Tax=Paenibacillus qinlingensis TaxID=1837343 RepID=UPI00156420F1|nr:TetR/AcrR family transcriptional regulator [Paenibacillus qinlingensis]NQX62731.1 TetR/AcrR family transcriptional regulator [Paenibacillus qinlingensis]
MPRLKEDQLKKIYEERKQQITLAAVRIFAQRGLPGTKISMITAEAGVSHGLFYHYFKTKEELFTSLVREAIETSMKEMDSLSQLTVSPIEKIKILTQGMLDENGAPYFMLLHRARNFEEVPEEVSQLIQQYPVDVYVKLLLPLFEEGQQRGEVADGEAEELIASYLTVLSGVMVLGKGYVTPQVDWLLRFVEKK